MIASNSDTPSKAVKILGTSLKDCQVQVVNEYVPFARVTGVDLRSVGLSDREALRHLMETHGVLIFPDQELTPEDELRVNQAFGYHDEANFGSFGYDWSPDYLGPSGAIPSCPTVQLQGNVCVKDHFGVDDLQLKLVIGFKEEGYHSDALHDQEDFKKREMPVLTSMYSWQAPKQGGETWFACTRTAFKQVPEERKAMLRRLRCHYENSAALELRGNCILQGGIRRIKRLNDAALIAQGHDDLDNPKWAENGSVHPLVRKHVDTGEEAIILNCGHLVYMDAPATDTSPAIFLSTKESFDLIQELLSDVCSPPKVYPHNFAPRDFVIWDNRMCLHSGPKLENLKGDRLNHRIRLRGSMAAHADCVALWDEVLHNREKNGQPAEAHSKL